MKFETRMKNIEDRGLAPREAATAWIGEAHQFGSFHAYSDWLLCQASEVYPLVKMPAQVVAAVRARHKGTPDHALRDQLYHVQRDVAFLFHLHQEATLRASIDHEGLCLRVIMLIKEIRALTIEKNALDRMRLGRADPSGRQLRREDATERDARRRYHEHLESWLSLLEEVRLRIHTFLGAAETLSRRYFGGVDILYPDTRQHLAWCLGTLADLADSYADIILGSHYQDRKLRDRVLALLEEEGGKEAGDPSGQSMTMPDKAGKVEALVKEWMLLAKAETLETMGEREAADRLARRLVREHMG